MIKHKTQKAFTLVELIVVITILAILGTIAFISLQGYSAQARDSKRVSDIQNIKKSLELFSLNSGKYPEPDIPFTVSYGSQDLRYQGTIGDQVSTNLSRNLNEKPVDPLTQSEYTYSRTYGGTEYEVLSIYESDLIVTSPQPSPLGGEGVAQLFSKIYAANANYPKINGNYNGVYVKAGTTYFPTPSIINALNIDLDFEEVTNGLESQIITGGDNNIANAGIESSTGGLSGMTVEVFSGVLDTTIGEDDNNNKELLAQALIDAYSGTTLASGGIYQEIVEATDLVSLVDNFVLNNDNFVNSTSTDDGLIITIYPGCNDSDITIGDYTISACNVGTSFVGTGSASYGNRYQFGKSDTSWENGNSSYSYDWKSPGGTDAGSANDWGISEAEKDTATYTNQNSIDQGLMKGPCASGYHIPTNAEWIGLYTAGGWGGNGTNMQIALKLPYAGARNWSGGGIVYDGSQGFYWSSSPNGGYGNRLAFDSNGIISSGYLARGNGFSVRCFKN